MVTAVVRTPVASVTWAGNLLTQITSISVTNGLDQRVAECRVAMPVKPGSGGHLDSLVITAGASGGTSRTIFDGFSVQGEYQLWPRQFVLIGRGQLYKALTYVNFEGATQDGGPGGLLLDDLTGGPATDQDIVQAVLDKAGVSYSSGNIGGTGTLLGTQADEAFMWRIGQSALDYIDSIDKISAVADPGAFYRTYETVGGVIHRSLVGGRPRSTANATYTEGENISAGSSTRSVLDLYNYVAVSGYDYGDGSGPVQFVLPGSNDFQDSSHPHTYSFASQMIERETIAESGDGMSCEEVATALSADVNREAVRIQGLETPLDDAVGPGATLLVQGPGGAAVRLGVGEKLWLQSITITPFPAYKQSYTCLGGGLDGGGDPDLPAVPQ
jgi:hypothetical protein